MSASTVISAIKAIWSLIRIARDLSANNASSVISLRDVENLVQHGNAEFFITVALADIQTTHRNFYSAWLPSILQESSKPGGITTEDVTGPTGTLHLMFDRLHNVSGLLQRQLNQLAAVFRQYETRFHIEELLQGVHAFIHGYGLLLHIHGVHAELHRIRLGATTLDDRRLLQDTLQVGVYLRESLAVIHWFTRPVVPGSINDPGTSRISSQRIAQVSDIRTHRNPGGVLNPPSTSWSFADEYTSHRFSAPHISLSDIAQPPAATVRSTNERQVRDARQNRINNVRARLRTVFEEPAMEFVAQTEILYTEMAERARLQGSTLPPMPRALKLGEELPIEKMIESKGKKIAEIADGVEVQNGSINGVVQST